MQRGLENPIQKKRRRRKQVDFQGNAWNLCTESEKVGETDCLNAWNSVPFVGPMGLPSAVYPSSALRPLPWLLGDEDPDQTATLEDGEWNL